jgi:polysaccharide biosynthesis transport protein
MESLPNIEEIDFQKHLQVLQRRWLPAISIFGVIVTSVSMYAFSLKPTYEARGSVLVKTDRTSTLTGLGENVGKLEPLTREGNPLETQAKIVESVPILQETIKTLKLRDKKGKPLEIDTLEKTLKVKAAPGTDVLEISYSDNNPRLAARVVNKIIDIYINTNVRENQTETISARNFIMKQLPESERSVRQSELALRKFKERNNVLVLEQEAINAVNTISKLEEEITEAQSEFVQVSAKVQKLRTQAKANSEQAVAYADLSEVKGTQEVLTQLQQAETQLQVERTRFNSEHPSVINLKEKITALKSLLAKRTSQVASSSQVISAGNLQMGELRQKLLGELVKDENERIALENKILKLSQEKLGYQKRASVLPKLEQVQREHERQLKAAQTTYETLLTRLQEAEVSQYQKVGNARTISRALVPTKPSGPKKKMFIGASILGGLVLGAIAAFGLDLVDRSLKTVREARGLFKYTLLGVIPSVNKRSKNNAWLDANDSSMPRVVVDAREFPLIDAYQMLQANLKFLSSDREIKAIVVTSSVSKEGKSEVAANLALAMSQVGRKVLLVDADMRRPVQHHIWNLTNAIGLSNVMVEQIASDTAIHKVMPNLFVLPSGVLPPNPVSLLDSNRMMTLVDSFTQDYDFIIFDTPSLAGTADAAVLSKLVDGTLLVVRPGTIDYSSAQAAKEFLVQSGQNVLGIVINGVSLKHEPDSYFYYSKDSIESDTRMLPGVFARNTNMSVVAKSDTFEKHR